MESRVNSVLIIVFEVLESHKVINLDSEGELERSRDNSSKNVEEIKTGSCDTVRSRGNRKKVSVCFTLANKCNKVHPESEVFGQRTYLLELSPALCRRWVVI